jgi:hypothetical protein
LNDDGASLLAEGLQEAILELRSAGRRVFVAEDTRYGPFNPAKAMQSRLIPFRHILQRLVSSDVDTSSPWAMPDPPFTSIEARLRLTAEKADATYMLTRPSLCVLDGCLYRKGDVPLFSDHSHLSSVGAKIAATHLGRAEVDEILACGRARSGG